MIVPFSAVLLICSVSCAPQRNASPLNEFNNQLNSDFHDTDLDKNGTLDIFELEQRIQRQDYDKDGCVSFTEFLRIRIHDSLKFSWAVFNHFDHNKDDCLEIQDQIDEFHEMDVNPKDGAVTLQELDVYYDKLFQNILPLLQNA